MTRKCLAAVALVALVVTFTGVASAQDAKTVIADAQKAMGYTGLNSIEYSGPLSHEGAGLGQWMSPTKGWHANTVKNFTRHIDLAAGTSIRNGLQSRPGDPSGLLPGGGGLDPTAAENQTSPTIAAGANYAARLEITLSAPGFLRLAAAAPNATVKKQSKYMVVSFDSGQKAPSGVPYKVSGYIDSKTHMLEKVQTAIEDDAVGDGGLFGDVVVEETFSGYKDFNGVKFPTKITQTRAGVLWNDATVESVKVNGPAPAATAAAGGGGRGGGGGAAAPAGGGGRGGGAAGGAAAPGGGGRGDAGAGAAPAGGGAPAAGGGRGGGAGAAGAAGGAPGGGGRGGGAGAPPAAGGQAAGGRGGAAPAAEGGAPAGGGGRGGGAAAASFRKIGDGVFVITSGYRSVAVEMKDGIVVIDAPVGGIEGTLAQVHLAIPNKPITHVVTSHMHFDHVAGLRTLLADGPKPVTLVTNEMNKDVVEQWFKNPHTLNTMTPAGGVPPVPGAAPAAGGRGGNAASYPYPDALAKSGKKVKFEYVKGDKLVLKDATNTIEIYPIKGAVHSEDMMIVYLPKAKAVYQADAWNPGAPGAATAGTGQLAFQKLLESELDDRLKLDYTIVVSGHAPGDGRDATKQDLMAAIGKK